MFWLHFMAFVHFLGEGVCVRVSSSYPLSSLVTVVTNGSRAGPWKCTWLWTLSMWCQWVKQTVEEVSMGCRGRHSTPGIPASPRILCWANNMNSEPAVSHPWCEGKKSEDLNTHQPCLSAPTTFDFVFMWTSLFNSQQAENNLDLRHKKWCFHGCV